MAQDPSACTALPKSVGGPTEGSSMQRSSARPQGASGAARDTRAPSRYGYGMIRRTVILAVVLVVALTGCASPTTAQPDAEPEQTSVPSPPQATAPGADCLPVSATWVAHFQEFMEEGYTVTRGAAVPSGDRYYSVAVLYASPSGEEILGTWGAGEDPAAETMSMVFPLDDVTASHTVVMMPVESVVTEAGAGAADAVRCLG